MKIAVVIPALDEAGQIAGAIRSARVPDEDVSILVVDGGSCDATAMRAKAEGAQVLSGARGRARQLDRGWRESGADTIVFLHADTRLGAGWLIALRAALVDPAVVGGSFRLRFDDQSAAMRFVEWGARLRVALFGLPYGDQAIFARRRVLEALGGVPDVQLMEDLDLVSAMKRHGKLVSLDVPATTSARRYLEGGVWCTLGHHIVALGGWRLGMPRERIARWVGR